MIAYAPYFIKKTRRLDFYGHVHVYSMLACVKTTFPYTTRTQKPLQVVLPYNVASPRRHRAAINDNGNFRFRFRCVGRKSRGLLYVCSLVARPSRARRARCQTKKDERHKSRTGVEERMVGRGWGRGQAVLEVGTQSEKGHGLRINAH